MPRATSGKDSSMVAQIRKKLGHCTMEWAPKHWLQMGDTEVNTVFGNPVYGIPYGRVMEISGMESHGKSAIAYHLMGLAQKEGCQPILVDFENSHDPDWAMRRGVDPERLIVLSSYVGTFGNNKPRMVSAEELCTEAESVVEEYSKRGADRQMIVLDSIPSMLTKSESMAGLEGANMRTKMDLPMLMSSLLRRWVGMAQVQNVLIVLINQLRQSPTVRFGDPWYTPGGNAVRFYSHVRIRVRRVKGGKITQGGKMIGIQGTATAIKNKAGGLEKSSVGYRLLFEGALKFVPAVSLTREGKGTEGEEEE